jgi:hypothetical protein
MNRQWRLRLRAVTAGLSLALWLFMMTAEACPALHAWMHGGTVPDNDDCAVVAIVANAPVIVPVMALEIILLPEFSVFHPASVVLPDGRGPPVPFVVS